MQINITRSIFIFTIVALIFCVPLCGMSAFYREGQQIDNPYPTLQSDSDIETNASNTLYLIFGAFVIVLVILGGVFLRRQKS